MENNNIQTAEGKEIQAALLSKDNFNANEELYDNHDLIAENEGSIKYLQENFMEEIVETMNMRKAYYAIVRYPDHFSGTKITVENFKAYCWQYWATIKDQLQAGKYKIILPDPDNAGILPNKESPVLETVFDRLIQQALVQVLESRLGIGSVNEYDRDRLDRKSVLKMLEYVLVGYQWIFTLDISEYFRECNLNVILDPVIKQMMDRRVLILLQQYFIRDKSKIEIHPVELIRDSQHLPFMAFIYRMFLHSLDRLLEESGHRFIRYQSIYMLFGKNRDETEEMDRSIRSYLPEVQNTI